MAILNDTQRFLHFNLSHTPSSDPGEDNHYVDIAFLLSAANRRAYRQGMVYHIANIVFDDADGDADIDVCTMPQNWTTQAAWQRGFTEWLKQQRAAADALGMEELGKWSDYKIYLDAQHKGETADLARLIDVNGNTFDYGDWDHSVYQIPQEGSTDPSEATIAMMGGRSGSHPALTHVGLLQQLELSVNQIVEDPNLDSSADQTIWGVMSSDQPDPEVISELIDDIEDDNTKPPYVDDIMGAGSAGSGSPSSPWVARTCMIKGGSNTSSPVAAVGGFAAPCGLLMIETNGGGSSSSPNSIGVTIELVPGEYKGVHAYPMRGGGF